MWKKGCLFLDGLWTAYLNHLSGGEGALLVKTAPTMGEERAGVCEDEDGRQRHKYL